MRLGTRFVTGDRAVRRYCGGDLRLVHTSQDVCPMCWLSPVLFLVLTICMAAAPAQAASQPPRTGEFTVIYTVDERGELRPCG